MGLQKGMSGELNLEPENEYKIVGQGHAPALRKNGTHSWGFHNMLYFSSKKTKDFVKIMFDKMHFTLYNT